MKVLTGGLAPRDHEAHKACPAAQVTLVHKDRLEGQVTLAVKVIKVTQVQAASLDYQGPKDSRVRMDLVESLVLPDLLDSLDSPVSSSAVLCYVCSLHRFYDYLEAVACADYQWRS